MINYFDEPNQVANGEWTPFNRVERRSWLERHTLLVRGILIYVAFLAFFFGLGYYLQAGR